MPDYENSTAGKRLTTAFRTLSDARHRRLLGIVRERAPTPVPTADLATRLAARTHDESLIAVTEDQHREQLVELRHYHLPALEDAGLLERDGDRGVVETTDHPAYRDAGIREVLDGPVDDPESLDGLFEGLADRRRRVVLSVLAGQYHPLDVRTLARDVAAREAGERERDVSVETVDRVHAALHHEHLPHLDERGLIDREGAADDGVERVTYAGHPALRARWLEPTLERAVADGPTTDGRSAGTSDDDVHALEGRETIVSRGQSLCERADEELFLLFSTTGLLEEGCFARIEDAVDRGVDVYLGSRDPVVRDAVRDRVPDVTLWEPHLDWLDLPVDGGFVGRLVFADREAVMVGTIGATQVDDAGYRETALCGSGAKHALVVLVRRLLGSRFDRIDDEDEDVPTELPF